MITRLSLDGYGAKRENFSPKTPNMGGGSGPHPVARITRLSLDGYGARRSGSFSGKTPHTGGGSSGSHPVLKITRLSLDGYGTRRVGSFAGRLQATSQQPSRSHKEEKQGFLWHHSLNREPKKEILKVVREIEKVEKKIKVASKEPELNYYELFSLQKELDILLKKREEWLTFLSTLVKPELTYVNKSFSIQKILLFLELLDDI